MLSYQELIAQKKALDEHIEKARQDEAKEALATIQQLIATFNFTIQQVFPWPLENKKKVPAKYYDAATGKSWTGRGKMPKWLHGKDLSQYETEPSPVVAYDAPRDEKNPFPVQ